MLNTHSLPPAFLINLVMHEIVNIYVTNNRQFVSIEYNYISRTVLINDFSLENYCDWNQCLPPSRVVQDRTHTVTIIIQQNIISRKYSSLHFLNSWKCTNNYRIWILNTRVRCRPYIKYADTIVKIDLLNL